MSVVEVLSLNYIKSDSWYDCVADLYCHRRSILLLSLFDILHLTSDNLHSHDGDL